MKKILLFIPFIIVAFIAFKPAGNIEIKEQKTVVILPSPMPLNDGLFWASKKGDTITISAYNSREYQIELNIDSTEIWNGNKLVGKIVNGNNAFDSLFAKDNR